MKSSDGWAVWLQDVVEVRSRVFHDSIFSSLDSPIDVHPPWTLRISRKLEDTEIVVSKRT